MKVSVVTFLKHTPSYALCTSAFQKMSDGSTYFLNIFLAEFSQKELSSCALFSAQRDEVNPESWTQLKGSNETKF